MKWFWMLLSEPIFFKRQPPLGNGGCFGEKLPFTLGIIYQMSAKYA
jgi:hypothetical protein